MLMPYLSQRTTSWINFCMVALLSVFCLGNGVYVLTQTPTQTIYTAFYSQLCVGNQTCNLQFNIINAVTQPVAIYYVLPNFVHNTKDYASSKMLIQLNGTPIDSNDASHCSPYITNADMGVSYSWNNSLINTGDIASPCGLQAKVMFTDSFSLVGSNGTLSIRRSGFINRFNREPYSAQRQWIDPLNEPFELWMHNSIGSDLRKLYGTIDQGLPAGLYNLSISNTYSYQAGQQKLVQLAPYQPGLENCFSLGVLLVASGCALPLAFAVHAYLTRANRISPTPS